MTYIGSAAFVASCVFLWWHVYSDILFSGADLWLILERLQRVLLVGPVEKLKPQQIGGYAVLRVLIYQNYYSYICCSVSCIYLFACVLLLSCLSICPPAMEFHLLICLCVPPIMCVCLFSCDGIFFPCMWLCLDVLVCLSMYLYVPAACVPVCYLSVCLWEYVCHSWLMFASYCSKFNDRPLCKQTH